MCRETRQSLEVALGLEPDWRPARARSSRRLPAVGSPCFPPGHRGGFTLIELLTVVAIVAVLATLLMTSLHSVQRKARETVCTSNLRQIGLALNMYLDDFGQRPPELQVLVSSKYLGSGDVLACPADKSRFSPVPGGKPRSLHVSYSHPLNWSDADWDRLMRADSQAGVAVCVLHDVRARGRSTGGFDALSEGLVLRGQLDGVVVRRMVFSSSPQMEVPLSDLSRGEALLPSVMDSPVGVDASNLLPPWDFFSDEPPP
jgi:prepilin-type N-terminal cleavage/methylation domain-containing protein